MSNDPYSGGGIGMNKIPAQTVVEKSESTVKEQPVVSRTMSPEVQAQLEHMARAMVAEPEPETEETEEVEQSEEESGKVEIEASPEASMAGFDTVFYRNTALDNPTVRARIESRCEDLDFADLILTGRVKQVVPISKNITADYQSLKASDNLWLEGQASRIQNEFEARAWMGYARLAMSLVAVNNKVLPNHIKDDGTLDHAQFEEKFKTMMGMSERLIEVLLVNMGWFDDRVGKLFAEDSEQLKNG